MECPECGGRVAQGDDGLACMECGLSLSQDWRAYDQEEQQRRSRAGPPETLLYSDKGLHTDVGDFSSDILYSRDLSPDQRTRAKRLHWLQRREKANADRTLTETLQELHRICSLVELPSNARELAARYVREALKAKIQTGRSLTLVAAASVLLAVRVLGMSRHHTAVAEAAGVNLKMLMKTYRQLKRVTGVKVAFLKPETVLPEICSRAGASRQLQRAAHMMLDCLRKRKNLSGYSPYSIAAAAVYYASIMLCPQPRLTQEEIAEAAGVSVMTVRNWYKYISNTLSHGDIPQLLEVSTR